MSSYAERVRQIAATNPDVADYRDLAELMLQEVRGEETQLLARLLPAYMRSVLSRRSGAGTDEEQWDSFLGERVPRSDGNETVFVRDASHDDIQAAAERRFRFSGNLDQRGRQFKAVAAAMTEGGARTVGALPAAVGVTTLRTLEAQLLQEKIARRSVEREVDSIPVLKRLRDKLRGHLAERSSPTIVMLTRRRDELVAEIEFVRWRNRETEILREVAREMVGRG